MVSFNVLILVVWPSVPNTSLEPKSVFRVNVISMFPESSISGITNDVSHIYCEPCLLTNERVAVDPSACAVIPVVISSVIIRSVTVSPQIISFPSSKTT